MFKLRICKARRVDLIIGGIDSRFIKVREAVTQVFRGTRIGFVPLPVQGVDGNGIWLDDGIVLVLVSRPLGVPGDDDADIVRAFRKLQRRIGSSTGTMAGAWGSGLTYTLG